MELLNRIYFDNPDKRFQECNFIERLWRYRYYLSVPIQAFRDWIDSIVENRSFSGDSFTYREWFEIHIGMAQVKMKWYYTMEELESNLKKLKEDFNKLDKTNSK